MGTANVAWQDRSRDICNTIAGLRVDGTPTLPTDPPPITGVVPEPGTLALLTMGFCAVGLRRKKLPSA
jgi:hypothetical protein